MSRFYEVLLLQTKVLQLEGCEKEAEMKMGEGSNSKGIPAMGKSYAIADQKLQRALPELVLTTAREVKKGMTLLVLGYEAEPVFLLEIDGAESGLEVGPDPELLGPPPWLEEVAQESKSTFNLILNITILAGDSEVFVKVLGSSPIYGSLIPWKTPGKWEISQVCLGPFSWPNSTSESAEGKCKRYGLCAMLLGPTTWSTYNIREAANLNKGECLLQPLFSLTKCVRPSTFLPPIPPPEKPPPQPPDVPSRVPRLDLDSSVSAIVTSLRVNGKFDAAGDDPGDLHFSPPLALTSESDYNLEVKVDFKGLARAILTRGSKGDKGTILAPLPAEPPPLPPTYSPTVRVFTSMALDTNGDHVHFQMGGRVCAASNDPGDLVLWFGWENLRPLPCATCQLEGAIGEELEFQRSHFQEFTMHCCRIIIEILHSSLEDKACFKGLALLGY